VVGLYFQRQNQVEALEAAAILHQIPTGMREQPTLAGEAVAQIQLMTLLKTVEAREEQA
tara:strand:- start:57 stop:233 length:177 start_codon:yes stop_codon:yes gene_type:complete